MRNFLDLSLGKAPLEFKAIEKDARCDRLKGYLTNNYQLLNQQVIYQYNQLYLDEESLRMSKSDLMLGPDFIKTKTA